MEEMKSLDVNRCPEKKFPEGFVWGAGSAALQVEGFPNADGGGHSLWQDFYDLPGTIYNGCRIEQACENYTRFREDIALMREMGLKHYRFSIPWPRIFPDGDGAPNPKGLDHYQQLIDALLENGVTPWVTIYHWELPAVLESRWGGWRDKRTAHALARFAGYVTEHISDRVKHFFTLNEIGCFTSGSYGAGAAGFPPAIAASRKVVNQTMYNACLAHGLCTQAIRAAARGEVEIGIADNPGIMTPLQPTAEDAAASREAFADYAGNILTLIMEGNFREKFVKNTGRNMPVYTDKELKIIHTPIDFLGLNIYHSFDVSAAPDTPEGYRLHMAKPEGFPRMDMPWADFTPEALYWGPRHAFDLWHPAKTYISENGCACRDAIDVQSGQVIDSDRMLFLRAYLGAAHQAIADGVPLAGYFYWSFMDNLEWRWGEEKRFGLVHLNYRTQQRTVKESGRLYQKIMERNALC